MWRGQTVAVILPTYNEKDSIRKSVLDFFATGLVDDVIVVNNNAALGTSEELLGTGAREIFEPRQGYGYALLRGIDSCRADLAILAEPDGTFSAHDLVKFLAYSDDVPVVFGTRTTQEFIWTGANMGKFLRWGNWAVAKMAEFLFGTSLLTDMGCTYRLFRSTALARIRPYLAIGGSHFGPQLLMETIAHQIPFVEIPVNYKSRVGVSSVTGSLWKAFWLGLRMIALVLTYRFFKQRSPRLAWNQTHPHPAHSAEAPGPIFTLPGVHALNDAITKGYREGDRPAEIESGGRLFGNTRPNLMPQGDEPQ